MKHEPVSLFLRIPFAREVYDFSNAWYGVPLWVIGLGVLPYVFGTRGGWDPLLWRSNIASLASHHTIILDFLAFVFILLWKKMGIKPLLAASSIFFVVAWHETLWWATDIAYYEINGISWQPLWFAGWLAVLCYFTLVVYPQYVIIPKKFMLLMVWFYLLWLSIGFPVTVNFNGIDPQWYLSNWVNGIEILSWVFGNTAFYIFERKKLLERQNQMVSALSQL